MTNLLEQAINCDDGGAAAFTYYFSILIVRVVIAPQFLQL